MIGPWARGPALLTASLGLHLLALTAISARFSADPPAPLFVDLTGLDATATPTGGDSVSSSPPGARDRPSPGAVTAPIRRIERATIPAPPASHAPAAPEPPAAPVPAAPSASTSAPPPAATPPTDPAPSVPTPATPPMATATTSATEPGATGSSPTADAETGAGAGASASGTREDAARASGDRGSGGTAGGLPGQSGALLALARPGEGRGDVPPEYAPYLARFRQRVEEALVYPLAARRQGHAGRVELAVLLEPSGRIGRVDVTVSSASAALDEAAVDAVRAIKPIPFPEGLPRRSLLVRLPLVFQLR
jgi:protein TonB